MSAFVVISVTRTDAFDFLKMTEIVSRRCRGGRRGITIARARLEGDLAHSPLCFFYGGRTGGKMGVV